VAGTGTDPAAPAPAGSPGAGAALLRADAAVSPYLYVAPFFLLFLGFMLFPLGYTLYVSLNDWNLIGGDEHTWAGLANYQALLADARFWNALRNTFSIWLLSTVPQLLLALGLAHVLNARLRRPTLFRMGVLLPNVASLVAVTIIFAQLFGRDFGLINWVLGLFGVEPIDWQAGRASSHVAIAVMVVWRWTGYHALIYLAAMQAIPKDLYEAASLDGAGGLRMLRSITIPALRPVIIFSVLISTIYGLQIFAEPLLFDAKPGSVTGGSGRQFQTISLYLYEQGFREFDFGYAATIGWVMFLLVVIVTLINYALTRRISSTR
jgi:cellobiose transport system permease protein